MRCGLSSHPQSGMLQSTRKSRKSHTLFTTESFGMRLLRSLYSSREKQFKNHPLAPFLASLSHCSNLLGCGVMGFPFLSRLFFPTASFRRDRKAEAERRAPPCSDARGSTFYPLPPSLSLSLSLPSSSRFFVQRKKTGESPSFSVVSVRLQSYHTGLTCLSFTLPLGAGPFAPSSL